MSAWNGTGQLRYWPEAGLPMKTAFMSLLAAMLLVAAQAHAQGWSDFATVSMTNATTPKLTSNRVCYSDGTDLACDGAAGLLSTSGSLVISTVAAGGLSVSGNTSLTAVSATNVSATGNVSAVKFIGDGSLLTGISGGGSSSATTEVSFHVDKNGASQTLATNAFAKLTWPREVYDTNSNFASDRFTPTVAGKYLFIAQMGSDGVRDCMLALYKNGSAATYSGENVLGGYDTSGQPVCRTVMMLDMNGSTDYVEVYGEIPGAITPSLTGATTRTFFQGSLLGPGQTSSGGGGSSSSGDRIVSTSANIVAYAGGTISLTTGGTSGTAYFSSTGLLVAPGISATQNVSSFTTLYASGKVGVGTANPSTPLHVYTSTGTATSRLQSNNSIFDLSIIDGGDAYLTNYQSGASINYTTSTGAHAFWTNSLQRAIIDGSGNVGIGTSVPVYSLDVSGTGIRSTASGSGYAVLNPGSWAATGYVGFYTSATTRIGYTGWGTVGGTLNMMTDGNTSVMLGTSSTSRLWIDPSGNVGIGNTSPNTKLEVAGAVSATSFNAGWERIAGSTAATSTATCSAGKQVIGGGCLMTAYNGSYGTGGYRCSFTLYGVDYFTPISNYPSSSTQWYCGCPSNVTATGTVTAYALCARLQ